MLIFYLAKQHVTLAATLINAFATWKATHHLTLQPFPRVAQVQVQPRGASLSGVQLNWKKVESSLRSTSLGLSPAVARQLQGLSSFKRIPSRTRRATDSNLVLETPSSAFSQVAFTVMAKARQDRRATEDNVLCDRGGAEPRPGPFSASDDEEDRHSEVIPADMRGASLGLSASGAAAAVALSRSFSRRRRATDSEALPGLESIHEGMHGGPTETSMGSPGLASADPKTDADDAEEEEEEDVKVSKIRLVLNALGEIECS